MIITKFLILNVVMESVDTQTYYNCTNDLVIIPTHGDSAKTFMTSMQLNLQMGKSYLVMQS